MTERIATLTGATGLVGGELLNRLLEDPFFDKIRILVRRPFPMEHPKLEKKLVDFEDADSLLVALDGSEVIFCAIGTTQKNVRGDKAAYRKVDFDIPVHVATYGHMVGCKTFVLVSSVGANSKSKTFYLELKGEVEDAVRATGIESIHIMRPSMLLGQRKESRPMEKIGQPLMSALSFLLPSKYKPIKAGDVAKAMLAVSKTSKPGFFVYEYHEMKSLVMKP